MAAYNKFNSFITEVATGTHNGFINLNTSVVNVYLSNAVPSASLDSVKTDLAEITNENGYTAPEDVQNASTQTTNVITVTGTEVVITAAGGTVGPFEYVVMYDDTAATDELICWWTYPGGAITLQDTETFTITFGASLFTLG